MHLVLLFIIRVLTPKDYTASHSHYINDKTGKTVDKICNSVAYTSKKGFVYPKQTLFSTKINPFFIPLAAVLPNLPTVLQSLSTSKPLSETTITDNLISPRRKERNT